MLTEDLVLEKQDYISCGIAREVYTTNDPNFVLKVDDDRPGRGGDNEVEAERWGSLPEKEGEFQVARCWLIKPGESTDLAMQRIYGEHGDAHFTDCPRTGICTRTVCQVRRAVEFWGEIIRDVHEENIIMDENGVIWLIDYAF